MKDNPDERPPDKRPPRCKITLTRDHLMRDHLMRDHPDERPPDKRPPWWETTLMRDHPMRDHPDERPPWWKKTLMRPPPPPPKCTHTHTHRHTHFSQFRCCNGWCYLILSVAPILTVYPPHTHTWMQICTLSQLMLCNGSCLNISTSERKTLSNKLKTRKLPKSCIPNWILQLIIKGPILHHATNA